MSRRTNRFHPAAQRAGIKVIRALADERAAKLAPIVKDIRHWYATQVARLLVRLAR
jgi:hypothetical protein